MANDHDRFHLFFPKPKMQAEDLDQGYAPKDVPLGGRHPIYTGLCRIEVDAERDCGCAFGQCAMGGIL